MTDAPVVERLDTAVYTVPTDAPEADGTLSWDSTALVLVTVRSGQVTGTGYTYTPAAAARVVDDLLAGIVVGCPVFDVPRLNEATHRAVRNAGLPGVAAQAIAAVDIALWDCKARLLDLPPRRSAGRRPTGRTGLRQRRVHDLRRRTAGPSAARLVRRAGHSARKDQDR
ncbi:hypothetical protein GCM10010234_39690 [Streptomyces hawaiiensis]|uniref:hypothetical protein n=1 Tax=Streptomyces hawaiiensis TaxID=67305 RepID=UPI0031D9BD14